MGFSFFYFLCSKEFLLLYMKVMNVEVVSKENGEQMKGNEVVDSLSFVFFFSFVA